MKSFITLGLIALISITQISLISANNKTNNQTNLGKAEKDSFIKG